MDDTVTEIAQAQRAGDWQGLDELVAALPRPVPEEHVADLLRSLVDDDDGLEVVFGVVHAAETADDAAYARGVVHALPDLLDPAPWWARTLLKRVANSPSAFAALLEAADGATDDERRALRETAAAIAAKSSDRFAEAAGALSDRVGGRR